MRWPTSISLLLLVTSGVTGAYYYASQSRFSVGHINYVEAVDQPSSRSWNEPLDQDATGNLIFQSLSSLMQVKPNSRYPNGHSIVRATIPSGTLLYHGSTTNAVPMMDWIAFDPEFAQGFARGDGTLFTFMSTRDLSLVYFDGASGNKVGGVIDSQDVLIWGKVNYQDKNGGVGGEKQRLKDICAWGKPYGIDGYIRMEFDFEIMYCDFFNGLEVVSALRVVPSAGRGPGWPGSDGTNRPDEDNHDSVPMGPPGGGPRGPGGPGRGGQATIPDGWKGALPGGTAFNEAAHTGYWWDDFPGDVRVHVDPSTMVTFFDPAFSSLIPSRRELPRGEYRLLNISQTDVNRARADLADAMGRSAHSGSGVDWVGLAHTVTQRFSDRLPLLRHLLHEPVTNVSAQAAEVRKHLSVSMMPYIPRGDVGASAWFARTAENCATGFTRYLHRPETSLTKQERVLRNAVDEVLHEICRVIGQAWEEAFDIEEQTALVAEERLSEWKTSVDELMQWLDWPVWNVCDPACGPNEICFLPQQGRFGRGKQETTPHCVSLINQH